MHSGLAERKKKKKKLEWHHHQNFKGQRPIATPES